MYNSCLLLLLLLTILDTTSCAEFRTYIGRDVDIREVPFIVLVLGDSGICTGFLVDVRWVITAAHCFISTKEATIAIGRNDARVPTRSFSAEVILHPEQHIRRHDIALLKLKMSIVMTNYAQIIAIDSVGWPNNNVTRRLCYSVGYGHHKKIGSSGVLHGGQVAIGHGKFYDNNCTGAALNDGCYWSYYHESVPLCYGDSGGPLVCDNVAIGVAVTVYRCEPDYDFVCHETAFTSYIDIYDHLSWIKSYIKCIPKCDCNLTRPSTLYFILFAFICLYYNDSLFY